MGAPHSVRLEVSSFRIIYTSFSSGVLFLARVRARCRKKWHWPLREPAEGAGGVFCLLEL